MTPYDHLRAIGCLDVAARVARKHGTTVDAMLSRTRIAEAVRARREVMLLLRETLALGWSEIGRVFGVDRATVAHHCRRRAS